LQRGRAQFEFSEQRRYREPGVTKTNCPDFCVLAPHELGIAISSEEIKNVFAGVRTALEHLSKLTQLWNRFSKEHFWEAEIPLWVPFQDLSVKVQIDALIERSSNQITIIDWKSYNVGGDTDARLQMALYGWVVLRSRRYRVRRPEDIELLECQVQEGTVVEHECSQEVFDELEDYIYRSMQRIFSVSQSKKLADARLEDFAFTDNSNNCEHCSVRPLCIAMLSKSWSPLSMECGEPFQEKQSVLPLT
jgi:hypothetical protein